MRLKRDIPTEDFVVVDAAPPGEKRPMCKLYRVVPEVVGEVQYDREGKMWTTDTGLQFRHSKHMISYYQERLRQTGADLAPGTYSVAVASVNQSGDRIVIRTRDGAEIIINSRG